MLCVCVGKLDELIVWDSAPPEEPKDLRERPVPVPAPIGTLLLKSGTLNVVEPSPIPKVVPIAEKRDE
jgi:hypothetical protein